MFLQNFTLIILKTAITGFTLIQNEHDPSNSAIHHQKVDIDRRNVSVPSRIEVRVESQRRKSEEVLYVCWDQSQKWHILAWSKTKDVSVDEHWDQDWVEAEEKCINGDLIHHSRRFRSRPDAVDQLIDHHPKNKVCYGRSQNHSILNTLRYQYVLPIIGAHRFDGCIRKRLN